MLGLEAVILSFFVYASVPFTIEGISRILFNNNGFAKVVEEWKLLAEFFNLEISSPNFAKFGSLKSSKLIASGFFQGHYFDCVWFRTSQNAVGQIACKIEIQNPKKLIFNLHKEILFLKKGNDLGTDLYFKNNFYLDNNNADAIALVLDDMMIPKVRKMFSRNLNSKLFIEKKEVNSAGKDSVLDETDTYFLVYTNALYPFQNRTERLFIQDNLLIMLEIARKIDGLKVE